LSDIAGLGDIIGLLDVIELFIAIELFIDVFVVLVLARVVFVSGAAPQAIVRAKAAPTHKVIINFCFIFLSSTKSLIFAIARMYSVFNYIWIQSQSGGI